MVQLQDVLLESSLIGIQVTLKTAWLGNLLAQDDWPGPGFFDALILFYYIKWIRECEITRTFPLIYPFLQGIAGFHITSSKFNTRKLSILLSCYLQEGLEQLKTHFHANFHPERALCFAIQYAWISKPLRDAEITWRPRYLSCGLKEGTHFGAFWYRNSHCTWKQYYSTYFKSS